MPIASCYPFLTLIIAAIFLGEPLTFRSISGAVLVIVGVIIVALPRCALAEAEGQQRQMLIANHWSGVGIAAGSASCAAAITLTRVAIANIAVLIADMIRLPFSAALCALISTVERRTAQLRSRGRTAPTPRS